MADSVVDDLLRRVWAAAGGFDHSFPSSEGAEREVLALVKQLRIVAEADPNPLGTLERVARLAQIP